MAQVIMEGEETDRARGRKRSLEKAFNTVESTSGWMPHQEQYKVYLYTVAWRKFDAHHALIPLIEIPAAGPTDRYKLVRFIPHPFPQNIGDTFGTGDDPFRDIDGKRIAQDICNPANPTLYQTLDDNRDKGFNEQDGTNLCKEGVFWSLHYPPLEEEIAAAEKRRDATYRARIRKADTLTVQEASKLPPDYGIALDRFGEERAWHQKMVVKKACPNCATPIPESVAFHFLPNGRTCVIDWDRAIAAGAVSEEDRPKKAAPNKA